MFFNTGKALSKAIENGNTEKCLRLIPKIKNINYHNSEGKTLLYEALETSQLEIFEALLRAGADPDITNSDGTTILQLAMKQKHEGIALQLIGKGLIPDFIDTNTKEFIKSLIAKNNTELLQTLIEMGFSVNSTLNSGKTIFLIACEQGVIETINLLVKLGSNLSEVDKDEKNGLYLAIENNNDKIVPLLIDLKLDPFSKTNEGISAFDLMIQNAKFDSVRSLITDNDQGDKFIRDAECMYIPFLKYWKDRVYQIISILDQKDDVNDISIVFIIIGISKLLQKWIRSYASFINDIKFNHPHLLTFEDTPKLILGNSQPSLRDLEWAICSLDVIKGCLIRMILNIQKINNQLPDAEEAVFDTTEVVASLSKGIIILGGPGDSVEKPLIVRFAPDHISGVMSEYECMHNHFTDIQELKLAGPHFEHYGHLIDKFWAKKKDGTQAFYFFDITDFFGRYSENQLNEIFRTGSLNSIIGE